MKRSFSFTLTATCFFLSTVLGCSTVKEATKGFLGVSTQVLEDNRKEAIKESFAVDYDNCYAKVKDILKEKGKEKAKEKAKEKGKENENENGSYIYAEDHQKKMVAIYLSETDTTPVGIFFTDEGNSHTMIEVSSPSTYAKEYIANKIFTGIKTAFNLKAEEKKPDVK